MLSWFKDCHKLCKGWFLQLVVAISMSQRPDKIFWCWPELLTETKSQFHTGTVAKCTSNPPFLTPVWPWKETETCISWGRVVQYTQSGYMGLSRQMCTDAVYEAMVIGPWTCIFLDMYFLLGTPDKHKIAGLLWPWQLLMSPDLV